MSCSIVTKKASVFLVLFFAWSIGSLSARDKLHIVGSSTVFPFAAVVTERFVLETGRPSPVLESTGTGGGIDLFCKGLGAATPDITNASARMKPAQLENCYENGVQNVLEVQIGFDGIVLAQSLEGEAFALSLQELYLALAKEIPAADGAGDGKTLIANPHRTWRDIASHLPDKPIEVLGPPSTSGTRAAFVEIAMEKGARPILEPMGKLEKKEFQRLAHTLREDGLFIEVGENDNVTVQKLRVNPNLVGIFGFSFLDQNRDTLRGLAIDETPPTFEAILEGTYAVSRSLFFYVKLDHTGVIPGLESYIESFLDERATAPDGYLAERGLIPLPLAAREKARSDFANRVLLTPARLEE